MEFLGVIPGATQEEKGTPGLAHSRRFCVEYSVAGGTRAYIPFAQVTEVEFVEEHILIK